MTQLGIIGGLSWVSSAEYYRILNQVGVERFGDNPRLVLQSLEFAATTELFRSPERAKTVIAEHGEALARFGCDALLLASNTVHFCYDELAGRVDVPVLHIADAVGSKLAELGVQRTLLLGTRYTMRMPFYADRLRERFGIEVVPLSDSQRRTVDGIIYAELVHGVTSDPSRRAYLAIIEEHARHGVQGAIMGCTEIPLLLKGADAPVPLVDSTFEHCMAALDFLGKGPRRGEASAT